MSSKVFGTMPGPGMHLQEELARSTDRVTVQTRFGPVTGGRALNGAAVFLGIYADIFSLDKGRSGAH